MNLMMAWRKRFPQTWAMRFVLLAGVLSAAEMVLPMFQDAIPRGPFALLSFLAVAGAAVARYKAAGGNVA